MKQNVMTLKGRSINDVSGNFVTLAGERFYAIQNVDKLDPFFISVISSSDHWLFISSTGGLTAGRVSPETALFPYIPSDRVHECSPHTGSMTILRCTISNVQYDWEPYNTEHGRQSNIRRNLYKNTLGNKICFEEINQDLQLVFRYTWLTSEKFGFVRDCELINLSGQKVRIDIIDGLQNILPAGTPRITQTNSSNLVDAYKWTELDKQTGLAYFTLYSGITDKAEPCESLKTNSVFCIGLDNPTVLLSNEQLCNFKQGKPVFTEENKRGIRGAYFVNKTLSLAPHKSKKWQIVANLEQSQSQVVELREQLKTSKRMSSSITSSIAKGDDELSKIMAGGDGFQITADENVSAHHYANVLFNQLRGGAFEHQYLISSEDFRNTIQLFNKRAYRNHLSFFDALPEQIEFSILLTSVIDLNEPDLERLCYEYLPIYFGRRHGDPSRPWNSFAINLTDSNNNRLLDYQGNWRDIFQNWEALSFSYPEFIENVISKFVNASTIDGHNPYRVTKQGFDWEVENPDDPWSYIGYWGDHQIIYLQKLLELSVGFHPEKLKDLLHREIFCYANVPYKIKTFKEIQVNAKDTVSYDEILATRIETRVLHMGGDGKLILDEKGCVYHVSLIEKLLVSLLAKLGNLVIDGGIWMNTQRPEWNDANNALVGNGLSMVTLCYLRRYVEFLSDLLSKESASINLSSEVADWLKSTNQSLSQLTSFLTDSPVDDTMRFEYLELVGMASCKYRTSVYQQNGFSGKTAVSSDILKSLLQNSLSAIDHTISTNRRSDGLYNAYNLIENNRQRISVETLYPMLEGQVAALSSGFLTSDQVVKVLDALASSSIFDLAQNSYKLYPERQLTGFLDKNIISEELINTVPLLHRMLAEKDDRIVCRDANGSYRFNACLVNSDTLEKRLVQLESSWGDMLKSAKQPLLRLYEQVFNHKEFTGRSGGMFGFEGLGCIYWHMVSKLLLAAQECFIYAHKNSPNDPVCGQIAKHYYAIRDGLCFNKTPSQYGAFPTDPYSHTPRHSGAQQPGMTGQVKEEILTRFGELGAQVIQGSIHFQPSLLLKKEFISESKVFRYLGVDDQWQEIILEKSELAFSWCQTPIIYKINDEVHPFIAVTCCTGEQQIVSGLTLSKKESANIFARNGEIKQISVTLNSSQLLNN